MYIFLKKRAQLYATCHIFTHTSCLISPWLVSLARIPLKYHILSDSSVYTCAYSRLCSRFRNSPRLHLPTHSCLPRSRLRMLTGHQYPPHTPRLPPWRKYTHLALTHSCGTQISHLLDTDYPRLVGDLWPSAR